MINYEAHSIILIDDECVMCNRLIRLVASKDHNDKFRICGLNSEVGKGILKEYDLENSSPESLILIEQNKIYFASDAVLKIAGDLNTYTWISKLIQIFPLSIRNRLYFLVAKNRYRLFGKATKCSIDPVLIKKIIH